MNYLIRVNVVAQDQCFFFNAMRRRDFIKVIAGSAAARPFAAHAQQDHQVRRVGMLLNGPEADAEMRLRVAAFQKAMQDLGWVAGRNLRVDARFSVNSDELREKARELVGFAPDAILAMAPPSVITLQKATRTIPIVFADVTDPVGMGIVQSLASPGGNATGFLSAEFNFGAKLLELLKEIAPGVRKVAVVTDADNQSAAAQFAAIQTAASSMSVELRLLGFNDMHGISDIARSGNGGLIALRLFEVIAHRGLIISLAAQHLLPAVYPLRVFAADGGLASYGPDAVQQFRQAASYVDRILKGEKPADLPVQAPTKYQLVINLKTAKAIGLTVPPSLLARADEVIE
jgi:putative ABC transport system substrate-binding protein